MKIINQNNKRSWIVCGISFVIAIICIAFLPHLIPMHFDGSIPDGYSGRIQIFLFPLSQAAVLFLGEIKAIKAWCLNYKPKTEVQYYLIIFGLIFLLMLVEIGIIVYSFI